MNLAGTDGLPKPRHRFPQIERSLRETRITPSLTLFCNSKRQFQGPGGTPYQFMDRVDGSEAEEASPERGRASLPRRWFCVDTAAQQHRPTREGFV